MTRTGCRAILLTLSFCIVSLMVSHAQVLQTIFTFNGADGYTAGSLVQGIDGNLYGQTWEGGKGKRCRFGGCGTVFKVTSDGQHKTLHDFCLRKSCTDGNDPNPGLALAPDGTLYGTTYAGGGNSCLFYGDGCGTVFKITPSGELTTLYRFCKSFYCPDGALPEGGLIFGTDGNLYGTTAQSGVHGWGTVFRITTSGELTTLYNFCSLTNCADGAYPASSLIQASDGNFYGTTLGGGTGNPAGCPDSSQGCGTIFRLTPWGDLTTLYSFCSQSDCTDGATPGALVETLSGSLFGPAFRSGNLECLAPYGCGTLFAVSPYGAERTLHIFEGGSDGAAPTAAMVQANDGNLYGVTSTTIYKVTQKGEFSTLISNDISDNWLTQATSGTFYGTADSLNGPGSIFSLSLGLQPFVSFVIPAGRIGQTGGILGQGFTGTTSVEISGVPAQFTVRSDTYLIATVPAGATTGYVTVTTPTGVLTSNVPFRVIQ
jgi:uncharacterized repeat protein (TIGR03803 family)